MQFIYDENASKEFLKIKDENYRYLFRVKRLKVGDVVSFRNLKDDFLFRYEIEEIGKKEATLRCVVIIRMPMSNLKNLHLFWCLIDTKIIFSTLPLLNQLGVSKITFVYCERSQKNFKIDLIKIKKILINSSQQCGRADLMEIEIIDSLEDVLKKYDDFAVLDFGGESLPEDISSIMIGCEGGFSDSERKTLENYRKIGLNTELILKSETAILAIAAKYLI